MTALYSTSVTRKVEPFKQATDIMETLLEKLEEECTCQICFEIFQQPKTFSCLHTFCLSCLNKLAERHRADGTMPCPKCRTPIPIPHDGTFDTTTTSFLHNRLVQLLAIRTSTHQNISCGNCKKETDDCSFCFDCSKIYCHSCLEAHAVIKAEHRVGALKEFHTEDYQDFLQRPVLCTEKFHENQPLVFYCKQCQLCLCQLCVVVSKDVHDKHKIVPLEEAAEAKKSSLLADITNLNQKKANLEEGVQEMDKIIREIDENVDSAKAEVQQLADLLIANIFKHCEASLAQLESVRASRKEIANNKKLKFKEDSEQFQDAIKFVQTLVNSRATTELLRKQEINKHFEDLLNAERDIKEEPRVNTFVKFVPGEEIQFVGTETEQIGQIFDNLQSDPIKSQLLNESLTNIQAGTKVSGLSVTTKASSGKRQYIPSNKVELIIDPANDVSDIQVMNHRNASYELSFVPRVPGRYQVDVKLNGENIAGSPVEMNVIERKLARLCTYNMPGEIESKPFGVAVSKEGDIAVSDRKNDCIVMFDKTGNFLRRLSHLGNKEGELTYPRSVAFNSRDELAVADSGNNRIQFLDKKSVRVIRTFGRQGSATGEFKCPTGVCVDDRDRVIVSDGGNDRVQVFDESGKFLFQFGNESERLEYPYQCVSYHHSFIVADYYNHMIKVFDSEGQFLYKFGGCGSENGQFKYPSGLVVDGRGNLLVCDRDNNRVQMFTMYGRFVGKTTCQLRAPVFAALFDDDKLVVTEHEGNRISIIKVT